MKATIKDLAAIVKEWPLPQIPVYIQVGYNRFGIATYEMHKDGYLLLVATENADNPKVAIPDPVEPDEPPPKRYA